MAEKKKSTAKKMAEKVVNIVKEIGEQPMQEQNLMSGNIPQEPVKGIENVAGINIIDKDGINIESKDGKLFVSYPNRKDIDYTMAKTSGLNFEKIGYVDAQEIDKLYPREKLQVKTIAFNLEDLNPDTASKLSTAIDKARTINFEQRTERDAAYDYFKEIAADKEIKILGKAFQKIDKPDGSKEIKPHFFNADIVKVGNHLIAGIEGATEKAVYVRLIETNTLPLTAKEYTDKQNSAKNHLGIKDDNIVKQTINGKEQETIKNVKRYIAYNSDWEISKVAPYEQKQEQAKVKNKRVVNTMAQ